jgi:hypothetical protein
MNHKYLKNNLLIHTTGLVTLFIMGFMHCRWCCISCFQGADHLQKLKHTATLRHRKKSHNFYSTKIPTRWSYWHNSHFSYHYYNEVYYVLAEWRCGKLMHGKNGTSHKLFLLPYSHFNVNHEFKT